jgi:Rrf2 family nitric oxide-sensitive transcriptional repressor
MRLTKHTDYGLRVLIALAVAGDKLITIEDLSARHRVSRNHLMKVTQALVALKLVDGIRGRARPDRRADRVPRRVPVPASRSRT